MISAAYKRKEAVVRAMFLSAASLSIIIVALIFLFIGKEAFPFLAEKGIGELLEGRWIPVSFQRETFGILPLLTGSLIVTVLGTFIAVPCGVITAVYISELEKPREREFLKPFIEILACIPSVVIGFFGLIVLSPIIKNFFGLHSGLTALTGAILLALMAIPTIVSVSEDAIRSVPRSYREASLALGATEMSTVWRIVVPAASSGIAAAVMLGVGRVIGETMAVLMVTGNAAITTISPLESVRTMTATIAAEMGEVSVGSAHYHALFMIGFILLLATFTLTLFSQKMLRRYRKYT